MDEHPHLLTLKEICSLVRQKRISLPTVQRGFVWKPYQIENLWDSLLRNFPVGSFVFSDKNNQLELLDGQQRATSIVLGFHNYFASCPDKEILKSSTDKIRLFIDLKKPDNQTHKFTFRVITQSHPWGYQKTQNQKVLTSDKIRQAKKEYRLKNNNPYATPIDRFWPFDADYPIPFGLFLNATSSDEIISRLTAWQEQNAKVTPPPLGQDYYTIENIFSAVERMLEKQKIPCLYLPEDILENETSPAMPTPENKENEDEIDEIENLFIRLNAGGTPLRGEELNYSILKANISTDLQNEIETQCNCFIRPSRFITIAFRLYQNHPQKQENKESNDTITMRIKPKQFQNIMRKSDNENPFVNFLKQLLNQNFLEHIKKVICYHPQNNTFGLPLFIASNLADRAPEVMLMLMYRLLFIDKKLKEETHRQLLGIITIFTWLGKGSYYRDHSKLIRQIWEMVKTEPTETFWSAALIKQARSNIEEEIPLLMHFPKFSQLKNMFGNKAAKDDIRSFSWENLIASQESRHFILKMFYEKELILYAQRNALFQWFKNNPEFNLEDTFRPFDWDHISPNSLVYRKWKINGILREWYQTNGNFRAWPYTLNRHDQNDSPSKKIFRIKPEDYDKMCSDIGCPQTNYQPNILYQWSCCSSDWNKINFTTTDLLNNNNTKTLILEIIKRNLQLCQIWYQELRINNLYVSKEKSFKSAA